MEFARWPGASLPPADDCCQLNFALRCLKLLLLLLLHAATCIGGMYDPFHRRITASPHRAASEASRDARNLQRPAWQRELPFLACLSGFVVPIGRSSPQLSVSDADVDAQVSWSRFASNSFSYSIRYLVGYLQSTTKKRLSRYIEEGAWSKSLPR